MKPEQQLQIAAAEYLTLALPSYCRFTAFPAGGGGVVRGKLLKAMGLKAGVPDFIFWWPERRTQILITGAIELKDRYKQPTPEQNDWLDFFNPFSAVCYSLNEIDRTITQWFGDDVRAHVPPDSPKPRAKRKVRKAA